MRFIRHSSLILLILSLTLIAYPVTQAQDDTGFSAAQQAELDTILADVVDSGTVGIVVWVDAPNAQYSGAAGLSSDADQTPMAIDDSFRVASNTKTFVAATMLLLQEEGLLDLDDLLSDYLPDVASMFERGDQVTLRQLLNHTSGIYNYTNSATDFMEFMSSEEDWTPQEIVEVAADRPFNSVFGPGGSWGYSNTNYVIAGLVIAEVTDSTAQEQIRLRILEPLGMESTFMDGYESPVGHLVDNHTMLDGTRGSFDYNTTPAYTAGAMVSNGPDLITFVRHVYTGDIFENPESHEEFLEFVATERNGDGGYALGVNRFVDDPLIYGHTGGWPGFVSIVAYAPDIETAVIVMVNSDYFMAEFDLFGTTRSIFGVVGLEIPDPDEAEEDPLADLQPAVDAMYSEGDTLTLPATPLRMSLYVVPGEPLANVSCFANTDITILQSGSIDGVNYYEIDCSGLTGWISADVIE